MVASLSAGKDYLVYSLFFVFPYVAAFILILSLILIGQKSLIPLGIIVLLLALVLVYLFGFFHLKKNHALSLFNFRIELAPYAISIVGILFLATIPLGLFDFSQAYVFGAYLWGFLLLILSFATKAQPLHFSEKQQKTETYTKYISFIVGAIFYLISVSLLGGILGTLTPIDYLLFSFPFLYIPYMAIHTLLLIIKEISPI